MNKEFEKVKSELDEMITNLRANVQKVLDGQQKVFSSKEHIKLYSNIYNLIIEGDRQNQAQEQQIYELYRKYQEKFLLKSVQIVKERNDKEKKFLEEFLNQEELYKYHTKKLNNYFAYLDRSIVEANNQGQYPTLKEQANKQFFNYFYSQFHQQLKECVKQKLAQDRIQKDKEVQKQLQKIVQIVSDMKNYGVKNTEQSIFQEIFDDSEQFYKNQYKKFQQTTTIEQLQLLVNFKQEEIDRIKTVFNSDEKLVQSQLIDTFNKQILVQYAEEISEKDNFCLKAILEYSQSEENQAANFKPFQELVKFFDGLRLKIELIEKGKNTNITFDNVAKRFQQIVSSQGMLIIDERRNGPQFLQKTEKEQLKGQQNNFLLELIRLQQRYKCLIEQEAENNHVLLISLGRAIEEITAKDQSFLMDAFLQKLGDYAQSQKDMEDRYDLPNLIQLLESFQAKDVFLKNYLNQLAHRLFTSQKKNTEKEKDIIEQIRKICGPENTKQLEAVLKDFESQQSEIQIGTVVVAPKILSKEYWPEFYPKIQIAFQKFDELKEAFKGKYNQIQQVNEWKDLTWQDQLSMVEIVFTTNQQYKVTLSQLGGAILFELDYDAHKQTADDIARKLGIEEKYMKHFQIQLKLLEKKELVQLNEQEVKFNQNFHSTKRNIFLPIILEQITEYQQLDMQTDRKIAIEAAVVRIMKAKKQQTYQEINAQVKQQIKLFEPKDMDIKQVIELLMDKDYLKRDPQNPNVFYYVS